MNNSAFPSCSSAQLSPRSIEARYNLVFKVKILLIKISSKAFLLIHFPSILHRNQVFKILSETLLTQQDLDADENEEDGESTFPKINPAPSRKSLGITGKSSLAFITNKRNDPSQSSIHNKAKSTVMRNSNKKTGRKGKGKGGGGDEPGKYSGMKDCHLSNVLRSAHRCVYELREAKESLSNLVANDDELTHGIKKSKPTEDHRQLAHIALNITNLCREAFIPAHRLNQTAIALYSAEDFLRYPSDIRTFDLQSSKGRIKLPDMTFNNATVMKLRQVVDLAAETYNKFNGKGRMGQELQEILFCILRGYQDFYAATIGCQEIFKVLLYTGAKDKAHLQQFLLALSAMDRSDLLVEIQELRRILDEIVIFLEKLSWGSFVVYRLAGGSAGSENLSSSYPDDQFVKNQVTVGMGIPAYPAYPLLKAKGPKLKHKKGINEESMEPSGIKLHMRQGSSFSSLSGEIKLNTKQGNSMKKSKFSKRKNMNDVNGNDAPVGDANFQPNLKNSDSSMIRSSNNNFSRIDSNDGRHSMMNLAK